MRYLIFTFIIALVFIPILFSTGVFWDDWVMYNNNPTVITSMYDQSGFPFSAIQHNYLLSTNYPFLSYKLIIIVFFLLSLFMLYKILIYTLKDKNLTYLILLVYITIPLNSAKLSLINTLALQYIFLFYLAFYFLILFLSTKNIYYRILAIIFFIPSFTLNSLFVYYIIVPFFILWKIHLEIKSIKDFFKKIIEYIDFILLPIILWVVKGLFFSGHGDYANYNKISFHKLSNAFTKTIESIITIFQQLIHKILSLPLEIYIVTILVSLLVVYSLKKISTPKFKIKDFFIFFFIGISLVYFSLFPYLAVGGIVDFNDWSSRNHIVSILGFSILFISFILLIPNIKFKLFLASNIILIFLVLNLQNTYQFQRDWYKQLSIIENFKHNEVIKNHTSFLVIDNIEEWNVNNRRIRFYEYSGIFKEAFGDEKRFALPIDSYRVKYYKKRKLDIFFKKKFKLSEYTYKETEYYIILNKAKDINLVSILKLKYNEIFDYKQFLKDVEKYITIDTKKL